MKYAAVTDSKDKGAAQLEMSYRTAERARYRLQLEQLQETLVLYAERKRLWTLRYDLARGAVDETTIPAAVKNMNAEVQTLESNLSTCRRTCSRCRAASPPSARSSTATNRGQILAGTEKIQFRRAGLYRQLPQLHRRRHLAVRAGTRFRRRTAGDLQDRATFDKIHAFWKTHAATLLNTELWQSGGYAVRLKEFLIALAIIVFGTWGARKLVHMFSWVVGKYFKFDETSRRTFDRFVFYLAGIAIFLTALHIVGIPLTAFAFLGGAIAIAIGFGAQNMFKNLMGGTC